MITASVAAITVFLCSPMLAWSADADDQHAQLLAEESYPSASQCAVCHQQIYREWASSSHAYASVSPMFHKFEQRINDLTQGTIGSFCVRCHQQVGTQRGEPREAPLWERSRVAREGITCITCHRAAGEFGRINGERRIDPGTIHAPVYNTVEDSVFNDVIARKDELKLATSEGERGAKIHAGVVPFPQISQSEFCASCHQVAVNIGIKLEVVWEQYRSSPAAAAGVTCQDCHMGKVPGKAAGYDRAPVAVIDGEAINPNRVHHNHAFYGPGYSIAHPGVFPHNPAAEAWTVREWLRFDWRAGWGTESFEDAVADAADAAVAMDDAAATLGVGPLGQGLAIIESALEALERRLDGSGRLATPLEDLAAAMAKLEEAVDADADEDALDEIRDQIEALEELANDDAAHSALGALGEVLDTFTGTWTTEAPRALFDSLQTAVTDLGEAGDEDARRKAFSAVQDAVLALRDVGAPGLALYAATVGVKVRFGVDFPEAWADAGDREDARAVIDDNLAALDVKRDQRQQVMSNGSKVIGPFFDAPPTAGEPLEFRYAVHNIGDGHNLPSGSLGAQPEIWLNVALIGPDGSNLWESGYVDGNGDFADVHSLELAAGRIEHDDQLFNLQTKYLTTNVKGTDREMYLPVNFDVDQLPFLRPAPQPVSVINHPPFVRMEGRSLPPLSSREATYRVPAALIATPGTYRLAVRLRSRAEPIYFMRFVGATVEMEQAMNEEIMDIHPYTVEFQVR